MVREKDLVRGMLKILQPCTIVAQSLINMINVPIYGKQKSPSYVIMWTVRTPKHRKYAENIVDGINGQNGMAIVAMVFNLGADPVKIPR